jgi:hypothetical protein
MRDAAFQTSSDATNVKAIEFRDGTRLTFEQAAKLIKNEGRLHYGPHMKNSVRPTTGVLEEWKECGNCLEPLWCYTPTKGKRLHNNWLTICLSTENDRPSQETPEQLCNRMVQYLRSWKRR